MGGPVDSEGRNGGNSGNDKGKHNDDEPGGAFRCLW